MKATNVTAASRRSPTSRPFVVFSVVLVLFACFGPLAAWGQPTANPPGKMSYQGFLTDNNGNPLGVAAPINRDTIFRIFSAPTAGNLRWSEQQTVTIDKGYFTIFLGEGSAVGSEPNTNNLAALFSGSDASDRYIEITLKGVGGGSDVTISPRVQFLTSPYSFLARQANSITGVGGAPLLTTFGTSVGINKPTPASQLDVGGTVTATAFSGDGFALTGLNGTNILAGTVGAGPLGSNSVTTPKLADGSVTTAKLADASVTASKMAAGALPVSQYMQLVDSGSASLMGSTILANAYIRGFSVVTNEILGAQLGGTPGPATVTLPPGTYYARISCPAAGWANHVALLRLGPAIHTFNTVTNLLVGTFESSGQRSVIEGQFILAATNSVSVIHIVTPVTFNDGINPPLVGNFSSGSGSIVENVVVGSSSTQRQISPSPRAGVFNLWKLR